MLQSVNLFHAMHYIKASLVLSFKQQYSVVLVHCCLSILVSVGKEIHTKTITCTKIKAQAKKQHALLSF